MQISVPIALAFIEEARKQTKTKTFVWTDFFDSDNMPNSKLLDEFYNHFGFRIEDEEWNFDISYVNQLISSTFDKLLRKISAAMSCYKCDIVLLSGRPTSLKQIEDIFLKYYPVSPNRLKVLNEYRVGRWYPFQDGDGYFDNQKTIVVTGALLGYMASEQGGFDNLSFDFKELIEKEIPTTNYFGVIDSSTRIMEEQNVLITPQKNSSNFVCSMLPLSIGCRQLNTSSYPSRLFYKFDFDDDRICQTLKDKGVQEADINEKLKEERQKITKKMPLTISISRNDYLNDKETLEIDGIYDREGEELPLKYFKLQVQSLNEYDDYWLDSGVFNLSITTRNND